MENNSILHQAKKGNLSEKKKAKEKKLRDSFSLTFSFFS